MEKRRSTRTNTRRRYRNQKPSTKEVILNLILKQTGFSIFLFLLIMIVQFIPLKSTILFVRNINHILYYNMSWNEAVETVQNTAVRIPVVKDWINKDPMTSEQEQQLSPMIDVETEPSKENGDIIQNQQINTEPEDNKDVLDDEVLDNENTEDIFILEPELGESGEDKNPEVP